MIYKLYRCLCQLSVICYLFICAFYSLLIVHFVHCSICFAFIFIDSLLILFKREKNNSDPELCSGISFP